MHYLNSLSAQNIKSIEDLRKISQQTIRCLLDDKDFLKKMILELPKNERLFAFSEHYDILDKLVLFVSEDQEIRLRLHIFADDYYDRPHNHRWSYSSYILSGGYQHTLFQPMINEGKISIEDLIPCMVRNEKKGDFYTLHHSQYHSVIAEPNTISLVFRGPSEKDKFIVMDRETKKSWWQYRATLESEEEKEKKKMTLSQFQCALEKLKKIGII